MSHDIITKNDWKTKPMPKKCATFQFKQDFTPEQLAALYKGHKPQAMEDKWFWYVENNKLYAHRSWTGICIYIVELNPQTGVHTVTVNRNPKQYSRTDTQEDLEWLSELLEEWTQPQYDY